ncbi:MAG TPA: hypothetical protein VE195_05385 [Acidobacteriaceae bacterium]|nr:hypothetical protein [Acidobacteriaceae bacterium]
MSPVSWRRHPYGLGAYDIEHVPGFPERPPIRKTAIRDDDSRCSEYLFSVETYPAELIAWIGWTIHWKIDQMRNGDST